MGQAASMQARLIEIDKQLTEARQRVRDLKPAAEAEQAAGILPEGSSTQAVYLAARRHMWQLTLEYLAVNDRWGERHHPSLLHA